MENAAGLKARLLTGPTGNWFKQAYKKFQKVKIRTKLRYTFMYLALGSIAVGVFFQSLFHIFVKEDNSPCDEESQEVDTTVSSKQS